MGNKNINQFSSLTDIATGDFLLLWDASAAITYKVYVNDINNLPGIRYNNRFYDILVDRNAWISGVIAGDTGNQTLKGLYTSILGGTLIMVSGDYSSVAGGERNRLSGAHSFIGGGLRNVSSGIYSVIGGGQTNTIASEHSFIGAGKSNVASGLKVFLGAGDSNIVRGERSSIIGGQNNTNAGADAFVGGGDSNQVRNVGNYGIIGAGISNDIIGNTASILGGDTNKATGDYTSIGGGLTNTASGHYSVVPGGTKNSARRDFSFAAGRNSVADHDGSHVFSDARGIDKLSAGQNTFTVDFSGGAWITGGSLNARRGFNLFPTGDAPTSTVGGRSGDFAYKDNFLYVFTGDNADLSNKNWGRVQLSTLNNTSPSVVSNDAEIVHGNGDNYVITNAFANVIFGTTTPIVTIPAGQGTWLMECAFGAYKGSSLATVVDAYLWNDSDSVKIPNTSGSFTMVANAAGKPIQYFLRTITGTNYVGGKLVRLAVRTQANEDATIVSTGSWVSWIRLR